MLTKIEFIVDPHLCQMEFVGWKKSHRRSRINKKWHKRYGPIMRCRGYAYNISGRLACCPCVADKIVNSTDPRA